MIEPIMYAGEERHPDGELARLYRFDNGYGASIVWDPRYEWNLAVVRFFDLDPEESYRWADGADEVQIDYTTPITFDVIRVEGPLTPDTIAILEEIMKLERNGS